MLVWMSCEWENTTFEHAFCNMFHLQAKQSFRKEQKYILRRNSEKNIGIFETLRHLIHQRRRSPRSSRHNGREPDETQLWCKKTTSGKDGRLFVYQLVVSFLSLLRLHSNCLWLLFLFTCCCIRRWGQRLSSCNWMRTRPGQASDTWTGDRRRCAGIVGLVHLLPASLIGSRSPALAATRPSWSDAYYRPLAGLSGRSGTA